MSADGRQRNPNARLRQTPQVARKPGAMSAEDSLLLLWVQGHRTQSVIDGCADSCASGEPTPEDPARPGEKAAEAPF